MKNLSKFRFPILILAVSSLFLLAGRPFQEVEPGIIIQGARLYNNLFRTLGVDAPMYSHPLWVGEEFEYAETWRCVNCHGWDFSGNLAKNYPPLLKLNNNSQDYFREWLDGSRNPEHDFSEFFTVASLKDISEFLQLNKDSYSRAYFDERIDGNMVDRIQGEKIYKSQCANCHALDGAKINFGNATAPIFIGDIAYHQPERVLFITSFGHLEINTADFLFSEITLTEFIDLAAYAQFLPRGELDGKSLLPSVDYSEQSGTDNILSLGLAILSIIMLANLVFKPITE